VNDSFAVDNDALGWIRPRQTIRAVLVSPPSATVTVLEKLAAATEGIHLTTVTPEEFAANAQGDADVIVLYRFVPSRILKQPSLFIFPPAGNPAFPVKATAANLTVADWDENHPAVRAVAPLLTEPLGKIAIVDRPGWAHTLVTTRYRGRERPVAFAGTRGGHRSALIAFDIVGANFPRADDTGSLLFLANLLDWLTADEDRVQVLHTGDVRLLTSRAWKAERIVDPRGRTQTPAPGALHALTASYAGIYRVETDNGTRLFLANLLDPTESDIGRPPRRHANRAKGEGRLAGKGPHVRHSAQAPFYALALLLLAGEWWMAGRQD